MSTSVEDLLNRIRREKGEATSLKELYAELFPPEFLPEDRQFRVWLQRYDLETIAASIERTAAWYGECLQAIEELELEGKKPPAALRKGKLDIIKYASGTMRNKTAAGDPES
jgi:hypothetical protein